jgi:hypothetical protein
MSCKLTLYEHPNYTGDHTNRTTTFTSSDNHGSKSRRIADRDSSGKVEGNCAWAIMEHGHNSGGGFIVGPNENVPNFHDSDHHGQGKGSTNHRFYKRGDRMHRVIKLVPPTDGYWADLDIYAKRADTRTGQWGHFPWVTDSLLQNPHDSNQLLTSHTDKGQPCPHGRASIIGHRKYRCTYTSRSSIKNLHDATASGDPRRAMWAQIAGKYCGGSATRLDEAVGGGSCRNHVNAINLAKEYCEQSGRIKSESGLCTSANLGGHYNSILKAWCDSGGNIKDSLCDALSATDKNALSKNYCDTSAGRNDSFCQCYNIVNGVCSNHSSAAGCAKKKQTFDKLVAATPSDQREVWSGMESCFGRVCTGSGKYIPPNTNQNCNKSVNVCIQDIDIGSMTDSNINPVCDIKAGDTPSAGPPPPSAAQDEVEQAKEALARGDAGATEDLKRAQEKLDRLEEEKGVDAYIPKSLEDLKTNKKKQMGVFGGGAFFMMLCLLILLVVLGSGGTVVQGRVGIRR